jgi:hypothetical protein
MTIVIRIPIHDHKYLGGAVKDIITWVIIFPGFKTEDASRILVTLYIFHPPRCPELLQNLPLIYLFI